MFGRDFNYYLFFCYRIMEKLSSSLPSDYDYLDVSQENDGYIFRTQQIKDEPSALTDDDRDSGTESDDEGAEIEELQKYMESIIHLDSNRHSDHRRSKRQPAPHQQVTTSDEGGGGQAPSPPRHRPHHPHRRRTTSNRSPDAAALDSALPSDSDHNFDHHSSEEELEVINSLHHHPEKRKWNGGGGSADEDDEFLCCPVEFRTSPPAHVHKPSKCLRQAHIPPHELCSVSPRKRHRRTPTAIQRPCLDFEKMQQEDKLPGANLNDDEEAIPPSFNPFGTDAR
ncbi:hypothetical protein AVEN_47417-1 [Araneus ventricosus]|uniref:Uncharacterized protein n=1 Tax=Araneus ventricosus TaxID=182803 RepID=A0A4Y2ITX7_ARAVE|nr:hypothetical protein AVEN_47417-1 [Araneus ventricosus]